MKEEIIYDAIDFEYEEEHRLDHVLIKVIHHKFKETSKVLKENKTNRKEDE
jgi:hypothetical protein